MHIIVCLDNRGGMSFHHRRQSRDRVVRADMLAMARDSVLWMNEFTRTQFEEAPQLRVAPDFLDRAEAGEYCFVEEGPVGPWLDRVEFLVLYHWNRDYPADRYLDVDPAKEGWHLACREEFPGYSHKKITKEVYRR